MNAEQPNNVGKVVWQDLTVPNTEAVRDFYAQVVGWTPKGHDMGEYEDFEMYAPGTDQCVAGICHPQGVNSAVPPQWLLYVQVADVDASVAKCKELGGEVLDGPRSSGGQQFCVIRDPAGAVMALIG